MAIREQGGEVEVLNGPSQTPRPEHSRGGRKIGPSGSRKISADRAAWPSQKKKMRGERKTQAFIRLKNCLRGRKAISHRGRGVGRKGE